jgi:hypothetical protein
MPKVFVKSLQSDAQHSENGDTDAMAHETGWIGSIDPKTIAKSRRRVLLLTGRRMDSLNRWNIFLISSFDQTATSMFIYGPIICASFELLFNICRSADQM